jgi:hypothetical protein
MNQKQIASLSLKLLGIYSIIEAIPLFRELSTVFAWRGSKIKMNSGPMHTGLLLSGILASVGLLLLVGVCLILFSKSFAKLMTTKDEQMADTTDITARSIQSIAFSVVGLVMIVMSIPHLVQIAANLEALRNFGSETMSRGISIGTWTYSIGIAVQFIIGLLLFFGGRGLSSLWYFFQKLRPMKEI